MAKLEHKKGIKTTYYFRVPKTFSKKIIDNIHKLGHEIGYHYEVLDKSRGNFARAIKLFEQEWKLFQRWNAKTICMHGNPLSRYDNQDLWRKYDFKNLGVEKEAYLSVDFSKINYFTDTGRAWNNAGISVKDRVNANTVDVKDTNHIISLIKNKKIGNFHILTHPCRWNNSIFLWLRELIFQNIKNTGKRLLLKY